MKPYRIYRHLTEGNVFKIADKIKLERKGNGPRRSSNK